MNRLAWQSRVMAGGNLTSSFGYNAVGSRIWSSDPKGNVTRTSYDGLQRPGSITDAAGGTNSFVYGANSGGNAFDSSGFKPTLVVDAKGYATEIVNDALYRTIQKTVTYGPGQTSGTQTVYDAVGNPVQETDPLGHSTWKSYDGLNRLISVVFADGATNSFGYTSTGLKWQSVDELGRESNTEYDAAGRAVLTRAPALTDGTRAVTQTVYDAAGNAIATINPLGARTDVTYDARDRKVRVAGPAVLDAATVALARPLKDSSYDNVGNVLTVTDPRNYVTASLYDEANRKTQVIAPAVPLGDQGEYVNPITLMQYDRNGNVLQVTDPNGHATINTYDALNRLVTTTDGAGITVAYEYDAVGNRMTVTDGKQQATHFEYDGLKRNTKVTDALGNATLTGYDALNKVSRTDAMGQLTGYTYDLRNRLLTVTYGANAPPSRSYGYDPAGRVLSVTEPALNGKADVFYGYDALNRVTSETSGGVTHQYGYDLAGNRVFTVYGGTGRALASTYDVLNRLQTVTESPTLSGGRVTQYAYDAAGNVAWKSLPNGDTVSTSYDGLNRAVEIAGYSATGNQLYLYGNSRDLVGNVVGIGEETANLPLRVLTMAYDGANRLISEQAAVGDQVTPTYYTYDAANNRASRATRDADGANTTTYDYDACNRLTSSQGRWGLASSYAYDANGSRISWTANNGLGASYGYDPEHRLTSLWQNGSQYNYTYDYRTRRVERVEDATTTKVIFSGGTSVQEIESGATTLEYVRGSDWGGGVGGILYTLRGAPSFTHYDGRGDVTAKTDGAGAVTYQASYQAFGTRTQEQGTTLDLQKANTKEEDPSGLLDEGQRYRDLLTDTFITADPAGFVDGPNLYSYVRQNPWTKFDPEGLYSWSEFKSDADAVMGGAVQGWGESNGASTVNRPSSAPNTYRAGLAVGHAVGAVQGYVETQIGGGMMGGGAVVATGGAVATVGTAGASSPVSVPVAVAGGAMVAGGALVTTHGALVAAHSAQLLAKDAGDAVSGSQKPEVSAKQTDSKKWQPGDDPNEPTNRGTDPSESTVRRREWKNEAKKPTREDFTDEDVARMREGKPPQRFNPDKGDVESMERSHEPVPKREGGTKTEPKWPQEHAEVDPQRRPRLLVKTLQYRFIDSKGGPIVVGTQKVVQMDTIPLTTGVITVNLEGKLDGKSGVFIKLAAGELCLSDGRAVRAVKTWNEENLPTQISYRIFGANYGVRVWNTYRVTHPNGTTTEDSFTGNAGMIIEQVEQCKRRYSCSDGPGTFNPTKFVFLIRWKSDS